MQKAMTVERFSITGAEPVHARRPQRHGRGVCEPGTRAGRGALQTTRETMHAAGHFGPGQQAGRRWAVGCVALEVTQRCNLDCAICYLSTQAEANPDPPLDELYRRIDRIVEHYGPGTDVQVTGGDPTLRRPEELVAIVARLAARGLRATLMTNGVRARRPLLEALAAAGLVDVAFHVDTTQGRRGYASEIALNDIRDRYLERTVGLPLSVFFNTTVHAGNFHEIAPLVRFFKARAGSIRTASFQLQADTGRGIWRRRGPGINLDSVSAEIQKGAATAINFHASLAGHPGCNRYGLCLEANGKLHDLLDDAAFIARLQPATAALRFKRRDPWASARDIVCWLAAHPTYLAPSVRWAARKLHAIAGDLLAARGRVHTLSFFVHDFMDACHLDTERINACVFKVMTAEGPTSMCSYNARREELIPRDCGCLGSRAAASPLATEQARRACDAPHYLPKGRGATSCE